MGSQAENLGRTLAGNIWHDQKVIWTRPGHVARKEAPKVILFTVITAALIATDEHSAGALPKGQAPFFSGFTDIGVGALGGTLAGMLVGGKIVHNDRAVETAVLGMEAVADSMAVGEVLKLATQRERPNVDHSEGRFFAGGASFPSGHALMSWSMATIIAREYKDKPLVRVGAYALATLVSLSRFPARQHFLSDVFAGSAGGFLIAKYVFHEHHDAAHEWSRVPLASVRFDPRTRTYGMTLSWRWR